MAHEESRRPPRSKPALPPVAREPQNTKPAPTPRKPQPALPAQQRLAAKSRAAADAAEQETAEDDELAPAAMSSFLMFSAVPSWMISMVVHMIILLMLALITFSGPEEIVAPNFEIGQDVEDQEIEQIPQQKIDLPDMPTEEQPTEVEPQPKPFEVEDITMDPPSMDDSAAPQAVELDPDGSKTAPDNSYSEDIGAFSGTDLAGRGRMSRGDLIRAGGTDGSEDAVLDALAWLAAHQNPDGSWSWNHQRGACQNRCGNPGSFEGKNGATGLALLPFLGKGQTHLEGDYKETVRRGLYYLLQNMKVAGNRGDLTDPDGKMYSHGICAIVLCEAYAMTQDRKLARPAQYAINHIVDWQDTVGGGWRYQPKEAGDTSVVGWQLMALKSAHLAYLEVPPATVLGASTFLDSVQEDSGSRYGYTGPGTGASTTSVGLLCRMYLGWKHDHPALERGVQFLSATGPSPTDMYYNYYATQVLHHYGDEMWEQWNDVMRDQLVNSQVQEGHEKGSWYMADPHGAGTGGRLYCTCMSCMILEVYYRHLPLYGNQAAEEDFPL